MYCPQLSKLFEAGTHRSLCQHCLSFACSILAYCRAENNGRSTDNVRTDRVLDRSNSRLTCHFDRSPLDMHVLFSIQLSLNAPQRCNDFYFLCLFCCFTTPERLCINRIGSSQIFVEHARHVARI